MLDSRLEDIGRESSSLDCLSRERRGNGEGLWCNVGVMVGGDCELEGGGVVHCEA